jgi:glutathione synthase/RimK-type ligase-like ATP-grasp enzyme
VDPIALATARDLPASDQDDDLLVAALARRDVPSQKVAWDDDVDWAGFAAVIVRSTWDYTARRDEFVAWAHRIAATTALHNPADVIEWNTHKGYLIELEERGAPIVPTAWLGAGDRVPLADLLAARGWDRAVVKPAVGAGSEGLLLVEPHTVDLAQHHLDAMLARGDAMVQPFLASVTDPGELSVIVVDGEVTHAVRKRPAPGDIRIQVEFGGVYTREQPDADTVALARWVVESTGHDLLYARVDLLEGDDGTPQLAELEVTEPSLYLQHAPDAADRLADAIVQRIG